MPTYRRTDRSRPRRTRRAPPTLLAIVGALLLACNGGSSDNGPAAQADAQSAGLPVEVAEVRAETLRETVRGVGSVRAVQTVELRAERAGLVETIAFEEGQAVEEGALLFALDDATLVRRLRAARAALRSARARLDNAESTLKRQKRLREERVVAEAAYDDALANLRQAAAEVDRLRAEVALTEQQIDDTRIEAPFAGLMSERLVDEGDYVRVGDHLATLYRADRLEVAFTVPERFVGRVSPGQPVAVRLDSQPDETVEGEVSFVAPAVNEASRDLLVKAQLGSPNSGVKPGSFATTTVTLETRAERPVIPEESLVGTRKGYIVFVVRDGVAHRRDVRIGLRVPGTVEIRDGLEVGETVVQSGHLRLSEGANVEIVDRAVDTGQRPVELPPSLDARSAPPSPPAGAVDAGEGAP